MILSDLLYYANFKLEILKCSIKIFLNNTDFKNIADECILLKPPNCKVYFTLEPKHITIDDFSICEKKFYYYQHLSKKINNGFALFEYNYANYWEEYVQILTSDERIIKDIIE